MRNKRLALVVSLVVAMLTASPVAALGADDVLVSGGGWGHGIGMPQWGAKSMADEGDTAEEILQYFYTGAQFGEVGDEFSNHAEPLRIGVAQHRTSMSFSPVGGDVSVCLGGLDCQTASPGQTWSIHVNGDMCRLKLDGVDVGGLTGCQGELTWADQPSTGVSFPDLNRTYARGKVIFEDYPLESFHVVVELPLKEYLLGLGEVPNSWPIEALEAQVIAARTYALYKAYVWRDLFNEPDKMAACGCHLYGSTWDQAYRGWYTNPKGDMTEAGPNGSRWVQAVQATEGKAMWHSKHGPSRALEAYYFSSTGGGTENNEDVWGGSPYEYLRSKPDPGPTSWSKGFTLQVFASYLGFDEVTWAGVTKRYDSGSPKEIVVQGTKNGSPLEKSYTGSQFKWALGLRSHYIKSITGFLPPGGDQVALHDPTTGKWLYRSSNGTLTDIYYGDPGDHALYGDWDCDGVDTPGLYRQSDGYVYLRNSNTQGVADVSFFFGNPGDVPLAGDFDGDGCDTVSIYRPSEARFYVINELGSADEGLGAADYSFLYGNVGDVPFVGDWTGDGIDTPGLRRDSDGFVYLRDTNTQGVADTSYFYGVEGDVVFAGDWDDDGDDTLGLYRPSNGFVYLRNTNTTGIADHQFPIGLRKYPVSGES